MHLFCSGAPPHNGCSAPYRVQCPISGAVPPCLWRLSGLWGSSGLALSSAWGTSWCLCGVSRCGSSEMSHAIPPHVFQTLKSHRWNCNVFGRCRKFGYPNCMRVLVDEAPKVNSCVRSSSHDTVHDPRDASTTPTPHNAKSRFPTNVARNSPTLHSNFETRLLVFQRFLVVLKSDRVELRARFVGKRARSGTSVGCQWGERASRALGHSGALVWC